MKFLCNFLISTFITFFPLCQNAKTFFLTRKVRYDFFSLFLEDVMTQQYAIDTLLLAQTNRQRQWMR